MKAILGRDERPPSYEVPLFVLEGKKVLITGAAGSIGQFLVSILHDSIVLPTDIDDMDVRDAAQVREVTDFFQPEYVFHIAGAKHAPAGEDDPFDVVQTNTVGTHNVLSAAGEARVVTASTCKSCNPETAYGASKLIAERMTLNAGGSVARFFNVVETQGNVFEIWAALDPDEPIPVTPCWRYFITIREAVGLLLWTAVLPPSRYAFYPGLPRSMVDVAKAVYPDRKIVEVPARRGDRRVEPSNAQDEVFFWLPESLWRVESQHDRATVTVERG